MSLLDIIWPWVWMGKILDYLAKHFTWIGFLMTFVMWITDCFDAIIGGGLDLMINKIAEMNMDSFQQASFSSLEGIQYINAVFPVTEFLQLSVAYCSLMVVVIALRWIKSFIPTISN